MSFTELIARLRELTAVNAHGDAMELAAREFGLNDLAGRFARINKRHLELGYLTPSLYGERYTAYEELERTARFEILSESEFKLFHSAL